MFIVKHLENKGKQKVGGTSFPKINIVHILVCIIWCDHEYMHRAILQNWVYMIYVFTYYTVNIFFHVFY